MSAASRLFLLFLAAAALPFLPPWAIPIPAVALAVATCFAPPPLRRSVGTGLWRIRWLLVAMSVLFLAFTPGGIEWVDLLARMLVLATIVAAVAWALHGLGPGELADGLTRLLTPLGSLGLATDLFARRLTLTLESVPRVQTLVTAAPGDVDGGPLERLASRAAAVIVAIESDAGDR